MKLTHRRELSFCQIQEFSGNGPLKPTARCHQPNYTHSVRYNLSMPVFDEKHDELEHFETRMGVPRGRLAVTMDLVTDAMALVGQHGVYCQSQRWPGRPVMDIQLVMRNLEGAKELIQSVMEELKKKA
jgi:hypothetical protein